MLPLTGFVILIIATLVKGAAVRSPNYNHDTSLKEVGDVAMITSRTAGCPNFRSETALAKYLGANAINLSTCSFREKFVCASLLASCPISCALAAMQAG